MKKAFFIIILFFAARVHAQIPDVAFVNYNYTNTSCEAFAYGEGSLIYIPDNAFCFEDGTACKQSITVKYRELHTPTDMLVAGINMLVERKGKRQALESAGMFEIRAESNGKPVKLCGGKTIQVRMKCRRNLPNLQAFIYNSKTKLWLDYGNVFDFSFTKKNNSSTSDKWGSSPQPVGGDTVYAQDSESMMVMPQKNFIPEDLPEGYFKGLNLKELGIFNYDRVLDDKNAIAFVPEFIVNTGDSIGPIIFVAYEKRNTLIQYYPDDFKERFVLLNEKGIKIFTQLADGSYATMKEGALETIDIASFKGTTQKIVLEKQPLKPKNKEELAAVTKISNK